MPETFEITAIYKNQPIVFNAIFSAFGYSYRIEVNVNGTPVIFEPDEEKNFRAYIPGIATEKSPPDPLLLQAIAQALETAFR